jgi:hypothetical protein
MHTCGTGDSPHPPRERGGATLRLTPPLLSTLRLTPPLYQRFGYASATELRYEDTMPSATPAGSFSSPLPPRSRGGCLLGGVGAFLRGRRSVGCLSTQRRQLSLWHLLQVLSHLLLMRNFARSLARSWRALWHALSALCGADNLAINLVTDGMLAKLFTGQLPPAPQA